MNIERNISLVLAHSVVYETKQCYSPNGIVDDARNGGDPPAPPTQQSAAEVLSAYQQSLPAILQIMQQQVGPTDQAFFDSQKNIAPQSAQLNADVYSQVAPQLAATDTNISNQLLSGQGADTVSKAYDLQRSVDQPWYQARDDAGSKLSDLLKGMDPNKLTGGELAEVERGVNRTNAANGNLSNPDATSTLGNALTFGSALNAKKDAVGHAIDTATNFLSQGKSGQDTFAQATGKTGTQALGQQFYQPQNGSQAFSTGNDVYNQITGLKTQQNDINANRRDSLDRLSEFNSSLPNIS